MSDPKLMPPPIPPGPVTVSPGTDKPALFGPGSFVDLGPGVDVIFVPAARVKDSGSPWRKPENMWERMDPNWFWKQGLVTPPEAIRADWEARLPPRKPPPAEADAVSQPKPGVDAPGPAPDQCGVAEWGFQGVHDMPPPSTDPWG